MDYQDALITAGPEGVVIRRYGILLRPKRIAYSEIRGVRQMRLGWLLWRLRIWGTTVPGFWCNLDVRRPRKSVGFVVDRGRLIKPVITPDDPEAFASALGGHDIVIT